MSMGAGSGCDAQYLFAEDVLGHTRGHKPRHAKVYRDFRTELDRLQDERIAAFKEFRADVDSGAHPEDKHLVPVADSEFEAFMKGLGTKRTAALASLGGGRQQAGGLGPSRRRPAKPRPARPASIITQVEASGTGDGAKATPLKLLSAGAAASSVKTSLPDLPCRRECRLCRRDRLDRDRRSSHWWRTVRLPPPVDRHVFPGSAHRGRSSPRRCRFWPDPGHRHEYSRASRSSR